MGEVPYALVKSDFGVQDAELVTFLFYEEEGEDEAVEEGLEEVDDLPVGETLGVDQEVDLEGEEVGGEDELADGEDQEPVEFLGSRSDSVIKNHEYRYDPDTDRTGENERHCVDEVLHHGPIGEAPPALLNIVRSLIDGGQKEEQHYS